MERGVAFLVGDDTLSYEAFSAATITAALDRSARELSTDTRCVEEDRRLLLQAGVTEIILDTNVQGGEFVGQPVDLIKVWIDRAGDDIWEELTRMSEDFRPIYPFSGPPAEYWFNPWNTILGGPSLGVQPVPSLAYEIRIWARCHSSPTTATRTGLPIGAELSEEIKAARFLRALEGDQKITAELDRWMALEGQYLRMSKSGQNAIQE
jgi:hypothetical protein